MPKKADKELKTESGIYKSQLRASANYTGEGADADKENAKVESIRLRVPKGWGQLMKDHVANNKDKYKSVNGMLQTLIRNEIGISDAENKE